MHICPLFCLALGFMSYTCWFGLCSIFKSCKGIVLHLIKIYDSYKTYQFHLALYFDSHHPVAIASAMHLCPLYTCMYVFVSLSIYSYSPPICIYTTMSSLICLLFSVFTYMLKYAPVSYHYLFAPYIYIYIMPMY